MKASAIHEGFDLSAWLSMARSTDAQAAESALRADEIGLRAFARLLSPGAASLLEPMARRAQALTRSHFGRTVSLYVPLYLSNYCSSGCAYCGYASDRDVPRCRLEPEAIEQELEALKQMGFEEVLLLTGERASPKDLAYLRDAVARAARHFHRVTIETFPMRTEEYEELVAEGCTGVTLYQETYDAERYAELHRWGPKRDYAARLEAPSRALEAGVRTVGLGVLLGLADPVADAILLLRHARELQRRFWKAGLTVSFPRLRPEVGGFQTAYDVDDAQLARLVFAFRLALPDAHLVLSTREPPALRDGLAGLGISKMSVASRTTVGGYAKSETAPGQFEVNDQRDVETFCQALRAKGLEPVFKDWDAVYR